ncbi:hypothetical protein VTN49DRAFT_3508 [Thermomyces lanuginosus]|uniref:uncharacterized protein n=1 Tax=Thermomyces lanuginosus TaxID=5541 RepID=UPI0037428AB1
MAARFTPPRSLSQRPAPLADNNDGDSSPRSSAPEPLDSVQSWRLSGGKPVAASHPQPLPTPSKSASPLPSGLLPSAPTSPPTPAPSPTPHHRPTSWQSVDEEDDVLTNAKIRFSSLSNAEKQRFLVDILNLCDNQQLSFVSSFVSPRLRKDPFQTLPTELCLRVLSFIDDPKTLARAAQVSKRWKELLRDDITWKHLCEKHAYAYRRSADDESDYFDAPSRPQSSSSSHLGARRKSMSSLTTSTGGPWTDSSSSSSRPRRSQPSSYRTHFKRKYLIESAWRKGGRRIQQHVTPDQGVVTSLHLTRKYIVVALDNAKIHVYDTNGGNQRTLEGHVMGVWAMVPWDDVLVSGGCDREVRVWNMATGKCLHRLRGHNSTVRCLKMADRNTAISGSRDTTLRIWDIVTGTCRGILTGHQASVRCLAIHGDIIVSGSYDTHARVWSISQACCLRTLSGHFSQIYAIAFDGKRVATGSLDTSVRIWDPHTGQCHAILQGHTSLVGQLQMRGDTLVTGGSDGSVRVWSLTQMRPIHRLAAHDNSVTSLQFDNTRIVSGGSDGRVKVWDLRTGQQLSELSEPSEAVWRVAFEEEKAVIMANRAGRTVMEVWSFSPPQEDLYEDDHENENHPVESTSSTPGLVSSSFAHSDDVGDLPDAPPSMSLDHDHAMPDAR